MKNYSLIKKYSAYLIALSIVLSGCATTQKISDQDRKHIEYVRINPNVKKAPEMYFLGQGGAFAGVFGLVGGIALEAYNEKEKPGKVLSDFAEKNGIKIEDIVFQEFDSSLRQSKKVSLMDTASSKDMVINLSVYQYGFSVPTGFSSNFVPILAIKCEMVDPSGKVIWSSSDRVLPLGNPVEAISLEEMHNHPNSIENSWRKASKTIVTNIVNTL